jgi:hypothetical protein
MSDFILPPWRGIEEAMQDVKTFARDASREKVIGLTKGGVRLFEVEGEALQAEMPADHVGRRDMFIIHGHPMLPAELSDGDLKSITGMRAAGNMAVCSVDDTVSWSSGINLGNIARLPEPLQVGLVESFIAQSVQWVSRFIDNGSMKDWDKLDERYVPLAHWCNQLYLREGFVKDYHLQSGEVEKAMLAKYADRMTGV